MHALLILNDAPYGSERTYNGLRLGPALAKAPGAQVTVFLMADAVSAAKKGQKTPDGYYNIERMVKRLATSPHRVLLCGSCMDARALADSELVEGATRSTMDELARETLASDRMLVF